MATSDLTDYIAGLPKAELHVHHVGSAGPEAVARLAARHPDSPVPTDPALLADYFRFTDFAHFIEVYVSVVDLIRDATDIHDLTYDVGVDLARQNVRYAEVTLTPYTSVIRGIAPEAYCEAVEAARVEVERDTGTVLRWCFDIPGELGIPAAEGTLDIALNQRPDGLISFGLGGPEIGVPREQFAPHFAAARAAGLHSAPHAGETTGPQTIRDAIEHLGAQRIGHGIAAAADPQLMEYLVEHDIALEVCPTSNVCTGAAPSLDAHPLPTLVAAGVPISINSDDPPMFSTTLLHEYAVAADLLGLDRAGITDLARAAVRQSFLDAPGRAALLAEIDAYAL
ncbi:adenosine deaminase [Millisia brevis]|uniref:adenosine deaminase n=1 Tax=Millisia brevis TaxID=264148 RepID=UPI00082BFB0B|nr:adenosine deaminase [Millisia brevis]